MDYLQGTLDCRMVGAGRSTFHGLFLAQHVHHDQRINLICTLTKLPHLSKSTYLDQRVVTASLHRFSEGKKIARLQNGTCYRLTSAVTGKTPDARDKLSFNLRAQFRIWVRRNRF